MHPPARKLDPLRGGAAATELTDLSTILPVDTLDPFDRIQLAHVVAVCRQQRKTANDAGRLKNYLAKWGLEFRHCTS